MEMSKELELELEFEIRKRALLLAESMFENKKESLIKEIKASLNAGKQNKARVFANLSSSELSGRRKQVFEVIKGNPFTDRYSIQEFLLNDFGIEVSQGSVSGRLTELTQSGLIEVTGFIKGKFGKEVSTYRVVA